MVRMSAVAGDYQADAETQTAEFGSGTGRQRRSRRAFEHLFS